MPGKGPPECDSPEFLLRLRSAWDFLLKSVPPSRRRLLKYANHNLAFALSILSWSILKNLFLSFSAVPLMGVDLARRLRPQA